MQLFKTTKLKMFLRNIFSTTPLLIGAAVVTKKDSTTNSEENSEFQMKPSQLPVYISIYSQKDKAREDHPVQKSSVIQALENGIIRPIRIQVFELCSEVSAKTKKMDNILETGRSHTQTTIDYLNEPENTMPRVGAIAIGGLAGMIFAVRGGFVRKVLYTGIGAGSIASLCYPKEAEHYGQIALQEAKKDFAIGYNFAMGIKPEDNHKKLPEAVSKFPTSFKDLSEIGYDVLNIVKDTIFQSKK